MHNLERQRRGSYVLITAARNEEQFIERTIVSVARQTVLPLHWVVVDNGSVDRTREVVRRCARLYPFLALQERQADGSGFASKVAAVNEAYQYLRGLPFEFVGVLDADISVEPTYFQRLLAHFRSNLRLGVAGGVIMEPNGREFRPRYGNAPDYVAGAVQMFRRACFEAIGGYVAVPYAHEDTVASEMARMHGWEVMSCAELQVFHHRRSSSGQGSLLAARFRQGQADYAIGYHPLFEAVKFVRRLGERPIVVGTSLRLAGYLWAALRRRERSVPAEFVSHLRARQALRLEHTLRKRTIHG